VFSSEINIAHNDLHMDIFIHWWAFRCLRTEFNANMIIVMEAIKLDIVLLVKVSTDMMVI